MQFDPSKYKITASAAYEVTDAEGNVIYLDEAQENPWTITFASPGTKKAMKALHELKQAQSGDLLGQLRGRKSSKSEASESILRADYLMKVTESTNAENLVYEGKLGMDALRAIYLDPFMAHVAGGAESFQTNMGNFSGASEKSSASTSATVPG